jgi:glycosyltransferase involved in cell wall biosynthesis/SAM-dependent methyltransferase
LDYDFGLDLESRNSLSLLTQRVKEKSTVLEFGPAHGRMTKHLKEELSCQIYGVEIDAKAAKSASIYSEKIVVGDIESYTWIEELENIKFDYVIFADVLEHLRFPDKVLKKVKDFLNEDGSILVSIPNIAHNSIIINLLNNEFNYSDTGLLDRTHVKFFTKKTFDELIRNCGYFIAYESAVYIKPEDTEFKNSYDELPSEVKKHLISLPHGEFYQLIYEIKKHENVMIKSDFSDEHKHFGTSYIQIFAESSGEYSEENSTRIAFENQKKVTFNLGKYKNIKSLRFDPLDSYLVLKIDSIDIDKKLIKTQDIRSNALHVKDNVYYFDTQDPQLFLYFDDLDSHSYISFSLEYLHIKQEAQAVVSLMQKQLLAESQNLMKNKDKHIKNLQKSMGDKNLQIQNLHDEVMHLHELAQSMRIKNRIKKLFPPKIREFLRLFYNKYKKIKDIYEKFKMLAHANGIFFTCNQYIKSKLHKSQALSFKKSELNLKTFDVVEETISIVIPTYNGLRELTKLIPQLINQKGFKKIEIIVVDSDSSDDTLEFLQNFPNIQVISMEQKDFSHSYARNLGFEKCSGKYVLFLVQDALPESDMWLYKFCNILQNNNLSALSCIQIVNSEADLYTCYSTDNFNKFLNLKEKITKITEKYIEDINISRNLAQLDNVACLFYSSEFSQYKFRGKYAEDLDIGLRLIKSDKKIGITSQTCVIHSHLRPAYYYMKRSMVESDILNDIFDQASIQDINIQDKLSDIYSSFFLIGELLSKLEECQRFPLNFSYFDNLMRDLLDKSISKEYGVENFSTVYAQIKNYDVDMANIFNDFYLHKVTLRKGDLFYSIDHFVKQGLNYMEQKYDKIDSTIFNEYCFFILKIFATNVGSQVGKHKKQFENSQSFISLWITKLGKGV